MEFEADEWRAGRDSRRAYAVSIFKHALDTDYPLRTLESSLGRLKQVIQYSTMTEADQILFRRYQSDLVNLMRNWNFLTEIDQFRFLNGLLVYSSAKKLAAKLSRQ